MFFWTQSLVIGPILHSKLPRMSGVTILPHLQCDWNSVVTREETKTL